MNDEQTIKYVTDMIIDNLAKRDCWEEAFAVKNDETNETLIAHIDGVIKLFEKAKKILENKGGKE